MFYAKKKIGNTIDIEGYIQEEREKREKEKLTEREEYKRKNGQRKKRMGKMHLEECIFSHRVTRANNNWDISSL